MIHRPTKSLRVVDCLVDIQHAIARTNIYLPEFSGVIDTFLDEHSANGIHGGGSPSSE